MIHATISLSSTSSNELLHANHVTASNIPCKSCNFRIINPPSLHAKSAHNPRRRVRRTNITNISPTSPTPSSIVISIQHPSLISVPISYSNRNLIQFQIQTSIFSVYSPSPSSTSPSSISSIISTSSSYVSWRVYWRVSPISTLSSYVSWRVYWRASPDSSSWSECVLLAVLVWVCLLLQCVLLTALV